MGHLSTRSSAEIGDIDNDDHLELLIYTWYHQCIEVYRNTTIPGEWNWEMIETWPLDTLAVGQELRLTDFDSDGDLDLVTTLFESFWRNETIPTSITEGDESRNEVLPEIFKLEVYPNPTSGNMRFQLKNTKQVAQVNEDYTISIFNILGQKINDITLRFQNNYIAEWNIGNHEGKLTNGLYIANIKKENINISKKFILLK